MHQQARQFIVPTYARTYSKMPPPIKKPSLELERAYIHSYREIMGDITDRPLPPSLPQRIRGCDWMWAVVIINYRPHIYIDTYLYSPPSETSRIFRVQ